MTYDNIKSHKEAGLHPHTFLEKRQMVAKLTSQAFVGLSTEFEYCLIYESLHIQRL